MVTFSRGLNLGLRRTWKRPAWCAASPCSLHGEQAWPDAQVQLQAPTAGLHPNQSLGELRSQGKELATTETDPEGADS